MKTILLLALVTLTAFTPAAFAQNSADALDHYIESARKSWDIPGLSVAIVQDGKVVLAKGYGVKEVGKNDAVDSQTLFGAMSTTKAMTAVAMALLVDEGKINWRDKVSKYLPDFRIADPYITQELEVRDLLTHTAGLASTDFLWARTPELPAEEAINRMQYARPAYSMRSNFIYQNSMYLVAGKVIEKVSGMTWEKFMNERVFRPLGMQSTFPTLHESLSHTNRSSPHFKIQGKVELIPEMPIDTVAPAGSVWSNADDIAKWVAYLLSGKTQDGKDLLKPGTLAEVFKPQVILPSGFYPTFNLIKPKWTTYGYGWFQHDYRGEKVDMHTGSIAGRTAIVGLMRDKKLGVYVFGNLDHAEARHGIIYKVFDLFAFNDTNGRDWNADFKKMYDAMEAEGEKQQAAQLAKRLTDTKPSLPLNAYAGTYSDPFYGTIEIQFADGKLKAIFSKDITAELQHRHVDTFMAVMNKRWMGEGIVSFQLNPITGDVVSVTSSGQVFRRQSK
ncbi:MAG TPA: serine hydrolase [Pyrinomonadaceae bacterium]|nr:serine hydrolase [Pyrinomonadaceae bacterium]